MFILYLEIMCIRKFELVKSLKINRILLRCMLFNWMFLINNSFVFLYKILIILLFGNFLVKFFLLKMFNFKSKCIGWFLFIIVVFNVLFDILLLLVIIICFWFVSVKMVFFMIFDIFFLFLFVIFFMLRILFFEW